MAFFSMLNLAALRRGPRFLGTFELSEALLSPASPEVAFDSMLHWVHISAGMAVVCGLTTAIVVVNEFKHQHEETAERSFKHISNKKFPWSAHECPLFDRECWHHFKALHQDLSNRAPNKASDEELSNKADDERTQWLAQVIGQCELGDCT